MSIPLSKLTLNDRVRAALAAKVLPNDLRVEVERSKAERVKFADHVYETVFSAEDRRKMNALPPGWLYESSSFYARIGPRHVSLNMSGDRRFPISCRMSTVVHYTAIDPLAIEYERIENRITEAQEKHDSAFHKLTGFLSRIKTVSELKRVYPELVPFALEIFSQRIQNAEVAANKQLALRIEEIKNLIEPLPTKKEEKNARDQGEESTPSTPGSAAAAATAGNPVRIKKRNRSPVS